jgi:hypothetical protein
MGFSAVAAVGSTGVVVVRSLFHLASGADMAVTAPTV